MSIWNTQRIKNFHKQHKCFYCGKTIAKSESYVSLKGIWVDMQEEDAFCCFPFLKAHNLCERCALLAETFTGEELIFDESKELGSYKLRGLQDTILESKLIDCPVCGSSNLYKCDLSVDKESCVCECKCGEKWSEDLSLEGIQKKIDAIKNSNPAAIKEGFVFPAKQLKKAAEHNIARHKEVGLID